MINEPEKLRENPPLEGI